MGRIPAYPRLVPKKRPTSDLFSPKVLTSLLGHVLLQFVLQLTMLLWTTGQAFYKPRPLDPEEDLEEFRPSYENVTLFLVTSHMYTLAAVVYSVGKPYRQSMWSCSKY